MSIGGLVFDPESFRQELSQIWEKVEQHEYPMHEDLGEAFYIEADGKGNSLCRHQITGERKSRRLSIGETNALVKVIEANFAKPLRDIPHLVSRIKAGGADPDLDERMGRFLAGFEKASKPIIKGQLGEGIVSGRDDYFKRTMNILYTTKYRTFVAVFLAYVQQKYGLTRHQAIEKYFNGRAGISDVLACWTLHLILKGTVTGD